MVQKTGVIPWAMAIVCVALAVAAFQALQAGHLSQQERSQNLAVVVLCGLGAAAAVWRILSGFRFAGMTVDDDAVRRLVRGGAPLRPSRMRALAAGAVLLAIGAGLLLFAHDMRRGLYLVAWVFAAGGAAMLGAVAAGLLPAGYLAFNRDGLVVALRRSALLFPWDRIVRVEAGTHAGNPAVFLWFDKADSIPVTPPEARADFMRQVRYCREFMDADYFIHTTPYLLALPVMVAAIRRYRQEPAARGELAE